MSLNVFSYSHRKLYYLNHPIKFIIETYYNVRAAWWRVTRGFAPRDVWNMDNWLIYILPPMLRYLAEYAAAYPFNKEFPDEEAWHEWLTNLASTLELTWDENWEGQNEYQEAFDTREVRHTRVENPDGSITVTPYFTKEQKEINERYFEREKELYEQQIDIQKDALKSLIQHLELLWD